jgi:hypothetical protein
MTLTAWGLISDIVGVILLALTLKFFFYAFPKKLTPCATFSKDKPEKSFMGYFSWFLYILSWGLIILGFALQLKDQLCKTN